MFCHLYYMLLIFYCRLNASPPPLTRLAKLAGERGWTLAEEVPEEGLAHATVLALVVQARGPAVPEGGEGRNLKALRVETEL